MRFERATAFLITCLSFVVMSHLTARNTAEHGEIQWRELPELPQALGGQFVGVIDDHLVVAGGSYFHTPPWDGGKKIWVDTVYTLGRDSQHWKLAGRLPTALGYGASITTAAGMLCIGGQTPTKCSRKAYRLRLRRETLQIDELPELPEPISMLGGALSGNTVYIAGGQNSPVATSALHSFFSLSLENPLRWIREPQWPGSPRMLPLLAGDRSEVFLLSGADLTGSLGPPPGRRFLKDAFRFSHSAGWTKIPNLPRSVQGGVALIWHGHLLVFSGNDGSLADREYELKYNHPGFSRDVLELDSQPGEWIRIGSMPYSLVTTGIVVWGDELVIAGGEIHPAVRSARVIASRLM